MLAGSPVTRLSQPFGSPASVRICTSARAASGVCSDGLRTTAQPAASAGPTLCATRFRGKLNGVTAATTPTPSGRVYAVMPSPPGTTLISNDSPVIVAASAAERRSVCTQRATSPRAAVMGFPASRRRRWASSSEPARTASAARCSTSARTCALSPPLKRDEPLQPLDRPGSCSPWRRCR